MYFLLQTVITMSASVKQNPLESIDVSRYKVLIVRIRRITAPGAGSIQFEDSFHQSESDFDPFGASVPLTTSTNITVVLTDPKRYFRWSTINLSTPATFMIEVLGREN